MTTTSLPAAGAGAAQARLVYRAITRHKAVVVALLACATLLAFLTDLATGPSGLTVTDVARTILARDAAAPASQVIVWDIRMPMALMALLVGASLAVSGAEMQTILNNPLASPFTLGISAAAAFGAALAMVTGVALVPFLGLLVVTGNAFLFAMLAALAIYGFSRLRGATTETMVLLGIAQVFLFNALLALLEYMASEQTLQQVVFWSLGSLTKASWPKIGVALAVLVVVAPPLAVQAWRLTALRLGDEKARSLGINVERLRLQVLLLVSVLAATAVAFVGTVGFVGLVGPHVARMLVGEDQRYFLAASALAGALLMALTSIVSKLVVPGAIIPIGIITSLIGVPFFLSLVLTRRRQLW